MDGTANPYLALSGILAAGLLGVKHSLPLKVKPCHGIYLFDVVNIDPASTLNDFKRRAAGITKTLPRSVPDALHYLQGDAKLIAELGEGFIKSYCNVKLVCSTLIWLIVG
jgi:glutamine synthetase